MLHLFCIQKLATKLHAGTLKCKPSTFGPLNNNLFWISLNSDYRINSGQPESLLCRFLIFRIWKAVADSLADYRWFYYADYRWFYSADCFECEMYVVTGFFMLFFMIFFAEPYEVTLEAGFFFFTCSDFSDGVDCPLFFLAPNPNLHLRWLEWDCWRRHQW